MSKLFRLGLVLRQGGYDMLCEKIRYPVIKILTPPDRYGWTAWSQGEFRFPRKRDLKKQGKSGSDGLAPREALYSRMRERGNSVDEPESPPPFSNEIRPAIKHGRMLQEKFGAAKGYIEEENK